MRGQKETGRAPSLCKPFNTCWDLEAIHLFTFETTSAQNHGEFLSHEATSGLPQHINKLNTSPHRYGLSVKPLRESYTCIIYVVPLHK